MNKRTFNLGDIVKFKDGYRESLVLTTREQFDKARAHFLSPERKVGEPTVLVESGDYTIAHPGEYLYVAACRPTSRLLLVLGQTPATADGKFTAGFVSADILDIVA